LTLPQKRRKIWVCLTTVTRPSTQRTFSQRICPKNFAPISLVKEKRVPTLILTSLTPETLKLKREAIILIANHFIKKDVGWFNEYHFMRMPNITEGVKKLLGNTKGPTGALGQLANLKYHKRRGIRNAGA
jgi:hypothetical protein